MGSVGSAEARPQGGKGEGMDPWLGTQLGMVPSTARSAQWPDKCMTAGPEKGTFLDYMLSLLLQCSTRLHDLEAINYYTHVIPIQSTIYKALNETCQGYMYTVSQNKDHATGPPMIHRGKAVLDQVVAEESLKENEGRNVMWPGVREVRDELNKSNPPVGINRAANI